MFSKRSSKQLDILQIYWLSTNGECNSDIVREDGRNVEKALRAPNNQKPTGFGMAINRASVHIQHLSWILHPILIIL